MSQKKRILIVDDTLSNIKILNDLLRDEYSISIATNGCDALDIAAAQNHPDLILLDIMMPDMDGYEVCTRLKQNLNTKNIPILFVTTKDDVEDETKGLQLGAEDYITKPFSPAIIKQRVRNHMALHIYQEHLENLVSQRTQQLRQSYIDTVHRLTLASEYKDQETGAHIRRISHYCRELSNRLGLDNEFCSEIFYASPMHDIGKVAIPDTILLKQGPLTDEEWNTMKTHTTIGASILMGAQSPILQMAVDIAASHHERWDGSGYPRGIKGDDIPLTARIMNITDQYDALRSMRPYKPGYSHEKTMEILTKGDGRTMPHHFDPNIHDCLIKVASDFNDIFEEFENG